MMTKKKYRERTSGLNLAGAILVLFSLAFGVEAIANEQPKPIENYQWVRMDDFHASFLKPASWQQTISQGKLMSSLIFSQPTTTKDETAATLTVNVITNLTKTNYQLVSDQLKHYADNLSAAGNLQIVSRAKLLRGTYVGESVTLQFPAVSTAASGRTRSRMEQRHYLANDKRDWLMVISFQSAASDWQHLQPVRDRLLASYYLD